MRHRPPLVQRPRRQRGAALLTAMIIVTLVATLATAMVWQQWRAVQVESAERARAQAGWILSGALQFAALILKETVHPGKPTALTDPWATPLAEARLSTFLAADKANADDGPEAFLAGSIADAQARYNLRNLVTQAQPPASGGSAPASGGGAPAPGPKISEPDLETLARLCQTVGVGADVASRIAQGMLQASATPLTGAAPLMPETVAQLTWFGVDPAAVAALQPYVVLLPTDTKPKLNVNTASKEALAAVMGGDSSRAERLVQIRQRTPLKTLEEVDAQLGQALTPAAKAQLTTQSTFFEVRGRLRLVDRVLVERSIVQRQINGKVVVLSRERVASLEQVGG